MANRYFNTNFWDDAYILEQCQSHEKLSFIYFFTNAKVNLSGIYKISLRKMSFETCIEETLIVDTLKKFENDGKLIYRDGWVAMKNTIKHQKLNKNIKTSIFNHLADAPPDLVEWVFGKKLDKPLKAFKSLDELLRHLETLDDKPAENPKKERKQVAKPKPEKDSTLPVKEQSLHTKTIQHFDKWRKEQVDTGITDFGKEGKQVQLIIKLAEKMEGDPEETIRVMCQTLWYLIKSNKKHWRELSYLPSILRSHWDSVLTESKKCARSSADYWEKKVGVA